MTETEAFELLLRRSKWTRAEVEKDPTSCAWFVAARAATKEAAEEAQRAGVIVARGKS